MAEQETHSVLSKKGPPASAPWWAHLCWKLWKICASIGTVVVAGLAVNVASTWLTSSHGVIPADSPFVGTLLAQWPITLLVGGCLLLIALLTFVLSQFRPPPKITADKQTSDTHRTTEQAAYPVRSVPRLSPVDRQERLLLLKRVRRLIEEMSETPLSQTAHIDLYFQEQPDALEDPLRHQYQELNRRPRLLLPGASVGQVYEQAESELLILGEPGAGKTTLLLKLACTLLEQAEHDEQEHMPIPVVFNLSSWTQKRQSLTDWLVEELLDKYQIPRKVGKDWINANQILPLLDGLDEVDKDARAACEQEIMAYRKQHLEEQGTAPMVICCRNHEYKALPPLRLKKAISIQPLTNEQIEDHLRNANGQLEGLQQALRDDPELYELAHTPIMLSVFTLAYQNVPSVDLAAEKTREAKQRQVWADYVDKMLHRRGKNPRYKEDQTKDRLAWLAMQMRRHQQTGGFHLERLQPNWLGVSLLHKLLFGLFTWAVIGTLVMMLLALTVIFIGIIFDHQLFLSGPVLLDSFRVYSIVGLLVALPSALSVKIEPVERFGWSWKLIWSSLRTIWGCLWSYAVIVGTLLFLVFWLTGFHLKEFDKNEMLGLLSLVLLGVFIGVMRGISRKELEEDYRARPNEGIWHSAQNSVLIGLICIPICGVFWSVFFGLLSPEDGEPLSRALFDGLLTGLLLAPLIGLYRGGTAFLKHFILRLLLWLTSSLPWKLVPFLDYAAEQLLLHKVGGGYKFKHGLLLDYFASLQKNES